MYLIQYIMLLLTVLNHVFKQRDFDQQVIQVIQASAKEITAQLCLPKCFYFFTHTTNL